MRFISGLKNLCTLNFLLRIKYFPSIFDKGEIKTKKCSKRIFFLDAPDYSNIGDQAIALAIRKFAEKHFSEYEFVEVLQKDIFKYIKSLKKQIKKEDIVFLTGGGNMGNIYKIFEATRRFIIKAFPNNKIVVFPQTIEYTDDVFGRCSCKYSKKIYSTHKNLILCAREEYSYRKMKEEYPNANIVLCPDIVLSLDKCYEENTSHNVSLCLRNDCERSLTDKDREYIHCLLNNENLSTRFISTIVDINEITRKNREIVVYDKFEEFSLSRFVITDRLHAMILCYLTNTPCIVFGNSNYKIKGVYNNIKDVSYITFLDNSNDLEKTIQKFNALSFVHQEEAKINFDTLVEIIRKD